MLRDIESKLAGLVEGTFGRLFGSVVTPAEIARGLVREMDDSRHQGLDRTWVADQYEVFLSEPDFERLGIPDPLLAEELSSELLTHARERRYALPTTPKVEFYLAEELEKGKFGVAATATETAPSSDASRAAAPVEAPEPVRAPRQQRAAPSPVVERTEAAAAGDVGALTLSLPGRRERVPSLGGVIGRSRDSDIVIASAEVSRRHCRVMPGPHFWFVEDLGSTNGVRVNGELISEPHAISNGDQLELGVIVIGVEIR